MKLNSAVFYSKDLTPLKDFYTNFLGCAIEDGSSDRFMSVLFENGFKLGIKVGDKPREIPGHQTVFVEVPDIENWYQKAIVQNIEVYKALVEQPWGRSFSVLDADGNKVEFLEEK